MKRIVLILLVMVLGCTASFAQSKNIANIQETQARLLDVNPSTYVKPLTCEIQVLPTGRIMDIWTLTMEQVKDLHGDLPNIRSWGVFQSSRKHNCDLLVAATFDFKTDPDNPSQFLLTVVGFPANFVNWKSIDEKDYEWLKIEKYITTDKRSNFEAIIK